ncbi:YhfC family intramembrane metalloprotease [Archangium lipolyticum]|uniref:YhfC family intramembrane metalloprotease n=1 Tax=Archangium lipolyticum TaxID=2970465 RepID=UPI00214A0EB5|nr:YhfC family intramembrane metalloprotease [Archangium lipolyticum]
MFSGLDVRLIASFVAAITFDILMPVVVVLWVRRRFGVAWRVIGIGALAFALSQLFTRVPAIQVIQYLLMDELKASAVLMNVWIAVLSLTAGLFEETARLIAFKYPLKDQRTWRNAIGFGAGHGGLESAVLIGGLAIIGLINVVVLSRMDVSTLPLAPEQLEQVRAAKAQISAIRWWEPLLGAYERVGAMLLHIAMTVLVLQRFLRNQRRWYWLAVGTHALMNGAAVVAMKAGGPFAAEGVVTLFALFSLWLILRLRPAHAQPVTP